MNARIAWLAVSLAAALVAAAHALLPARVVALRATDLLGAEAAIAAAQRGQSALLQQLLVGEFIAAAPWLACGAALALLLRGALRSWQRDDRRPRTQPIVDAAGMALDLSGMPFDHVPARDMLKLAPMPATRMPQGASELERQAFAALGAAATLPVDPQSGTTLLQRAQCRYDAAVRQYGAGSLVAIGAAICDLGWLVAHEERAGRWIAVHWQPDHLATLALARLPAYWQLSADDRARIGALLDYLATQQTPLHAAPELNAALRALRALQVRCAGVAMHAAPGAQRIDVPSGMQRADARHSGAGPYPPVRAATTVACAWLLAGGLVLLSSLAHAQDAPMNPPRLVPLPPQRIGDIVVDAGVVPVWTAPSLEPGAVPRTGQQVGDAGIVARIPPPAPRRRSAGVSLEGVADRPEWRATVPAGHGVPLAAAVVRIAPPGLPPPGFADIDAALLQVPVSWSAGLDRTTALEGILRANGLRATVSDAGLSVSRTAPAAAAAVDDPAAWRRRAEELEVAAQEARRAELATLAREREELETRRRAAELELQQLQQASEKLQNEHRLRLSATGAAFTDREWRLSPDDSTLRQGLARWARLEGVGFAWEADYDLPVVAELAYRGPLPTVIERLLQKVPPASKLIYSLDRQHGLVVRAAPQS